MTTWLKALIVPLIAAAIWLLPSDRPQVEVAGAIETAALADAAPTTSEASSTTTNASTSIAAEPDADIDLPVAEAPVAETTTTSTTSTTTTIVVTSATPTTAAPTTAAPTSTPLSLGQQALARVSFDWRSAFPDWRVEFRGPRNGIRALTYPDQKRIEIFVRSSDTAATLHRVFAHELGHVVDVEWNSDQDRARWVDQRGIRGSAPWWPNAEAPDFATGAGDFAEAFAVWETGVTTRSTVSRQPTRGDLDLLRELSQR